MIWPVYVLLCEVLFFTFFVACFFGVWMIHTLFRSNCTDNEIFTKICFGEVFYVLFLFFWFSCVLCTNIGSMLPLLTAKGG